MTVSRVSMSALRLIGLVAGVSWSASFIALPAATAGPMANDPKGFNGIPWGSSLEGRPEFSLVSSTARIKEYEFKNGPLPLGEAKVETMRFATLDGKFARVIIRYQGKDAHAKVLAHLQAQYGPLDRTPGQITRGLTQQHNWRGADTEINLSYEGRNERGFIFIENTVLAPRFNDTIPEDSY